MEQRLSEISQRGADTAIQQQAAPECACCNQIYHPNRALADRVEAALFGSEPYAVCPICEQNVSDELQTESYKK